jgi:hypothetical protein
MSCSRLRGRSKPDARARIDNSARTGTITAARSSLGARAMLSDWRGRGERWGRACARGGLDQEVGGRGDGHGR